MISGSVNTNREAVISLVVNGPSGQVQEIEAVIDTGFTGSLTLPSVVIGFLELSWLGRGETMLGDGSFHPVDVYAATVM
jgi:predicted aspartyl protease